MAASPMNDFDLSGLESLYRLRRSQYDISTISTAVVRTSGVDQILRARLHFGHHGDGIERSAGTRDYGTLVLDRRNLTPDAGIRLARLLTSGTGLDPSSRVGTLGFPTRIQTRAAGDVLTRPFPERGTLLWPSHQFYFSTGPNPVLGDLQGPLVAPNQPPILEPWKVVNQWLGMGQGMWPVNTRNSLEIVVPDLRVAIRTITFDQNRLLVNVDVPEWNREDVRFSAAATDGVTESTLNVSGDPRAGPVEMSPVPAWSQLAIFASGRDGSEVIDWAQLYSTIAYPEFYVKWTFPEQQLRRLIEEWETQTVEFKASAQDLGDIVQSVVAFANSNDGAIIIGVNEARDIVGIGNPTKLEERIRQAISEYCDPTANPSFSTLEALGKTVMVVSVPKGSQTPYLHTGRGTVYIRRGAYDFPTKTRNELDNLYPQRS